METIAMASEPQTAQEPCPRSLYVGLASSQGQVRRRNEDSVLAWHFTFLAEGQLPWPIGLFVLADGMGGHRHGAEASALVTRVAAGYVIRQVCLPILSAEESGDRPPIHQVLETGVHLAHDAVLRRLPEAGATLTMALLLGDSVYLAHVGDSRAYLGQRGSLRPLTKDHSVAARLVEMGQATAEEVDAQRHILYKAVGQGKTVQPDVTYHSFKKGQYLLLCCDGLWSTVSEAEMATIIEEASSPHCACQELVNRANELGSDDNISVIVVAWEWPLPEEPASVDAEQNHGI